MLARSIPPGPRQVLPGSQVLALRRDPTGFLLRLAREYGPIVRLRLAGRDTFLLNDPDHIRDVLVTHQRNFRKGPALDRARRLLGDGLLTSNGEHHQRQRRLAQPAFHRQRVASYGEVMVEYALRTRARWQDGATLDLSHEMMQLTLGIVGKTLFDADVEGEADELGAALTDIVNLFDLVSLPFAELLERLPLPSNRRFARAKARLDATIYRLIQERRQQPTDRGDLLSMLLLTHDVEGDGGQMSDTQVRDEALTLFLAGHETTANALSWTWYLLAQHPEVVAQLQAELDRVLGSRPPTVDDLSHLSYTRMIFSEALRLYPPAWIIGRRALEDYPIGGYVIPANAVVIMSQYVMHHSPRYYPEPFRFDPLRWTPEAQQGRPKFAYFPFGGGTRLCIGEAFAWMEGVLLLATLAQQWQMRPVPGQQVALQPRVTLRPRDGLRLRLERRRA